MKIKNIQHPLRKKFPPSEPCSCSICRSYCIRPGWWLVEEARLAIQNGLANRMMLEVSPDKTFAVLAPSFKGNEGMFAMQIFSKNYCTFFNNGLCDLFGKDYQPLECRFVHHNRKGQGIICHTTIEKDWNTIAGKKLVKEWVQLTNFLEKASKLFPKELLENLKFL